MRVRVCVRARVWLFEDIRALTSLIFSGVLLLLSIYFLGPVTLREVVAESGAQQILKISVPPFSLGSLLSGNGMVQEPECDKEKERGRRPSWQSTMPRRKGLNVRYQARLTSSSGVPSARRGICHAQLKIADRKSCTLV
jgi:hypothetical protein